MLPAASLAAFVLARYRFKGRELVYGLFTLGLLFPVAVAILPLFIVLRQVGLLSNPLGVALPQAAFGLPIAIIIMRPFFRAIPQGAPGRRGDRRLRAVALLLVGDAAAVAAGAEHGRRASRSSASWNAFLLPLLVLVDPEPAHAADRREQHLGAVLDRLRPGARLHHAAMVPALLFYAIAERQIIGGLTAGAVKE